MSLVLSITPALLSIFGKPRLHGYMQRNTLPVAPRKNVPAHEVRFEAWSAWNVNTKIAVIPAPLERAIGPLPRGHGCSPGTFVVVAIAVVIYDFSILFIAFRRYPRRLSTAWARLLSYILPMHSHSTAGIDQDMCTRRPPLADSRLLQERTR